MKSLVLISLLALAAATPVTKLDRKFSAEEENHRNARTYLLVEKEKDVFTVDYLNSSAPRLSATKDDATLYLYTQSNRDAPVILGMDDINVLGASRVFDAGKSNVFIAHGWNNDHTSTIFSIVVPAILDNYDVNVFVVDWAGPANSNYISARNAVAVIGEAVGQFINQMLLQFGLKPDRFVLIGHSLGAHVAGKAGSTVDGQVSTIIGLDPASPLFTMANLDARLDTGDADYVHVIHTCGGLLGFLAPIGHSDYYPNGGESQPGCGLDLAGTCAHSRSYQYFAESVRNNAFVSRSCDSIYSYSDGLCKDHARSFLGGYKIDTSASGSYFLETNSVEPFGRGE